jgi:hypothetical protein
MPSRRLAPVRAVVSAASGLALFLGSTGAKAAAPACPASLEVAEAPAAVPPGFRAFLNGDPPAASFERPAAHRLDSIMFSEGRPDAMAWLAPSAGGRDAQHWDFAPGGGAAAWLSCGYLATSVILSIPLPAATRSCRVIYDPAISPPTASAVTCR